MNARIFPPATYISVEEFSEHVNDYFHRARSGERIIVTISGKPAYDLIYNDSRATAVPLASRRRLEPKDYAALLDLLEPLD